ncbi:porin family protein [Rhodohalobacter sp. SW132]|uniref:outer membrane protein n=1 Tax=Rhodohalobacter sp. SW132 TaxID=2293433 RepID=UPI000E221EC4|nr:outer membrane beta-barrel protein [Rhodohalobacter sp. SW132]REL37853.1 porin family protein [Rhodohalobacter sp. SW132]
MIHRILVILSLMLGTAVFTASAQSAAERASISDTFGFGPRLGYYKAQDADEGNFYGGAQMRIRPGAIIGIEAAVEYRAGQEYGINGNSVKTSFVPVTASLLAFAPVSENFSPYGVAGLGAYYTRYTTSGVLEDLGFDDDSDFNLGYHLGFGAEIPFNENVALNIDYRYLFLNPSDNQESLDGASFSGNTISAGLMFYF